MNMSAHPLFVRGVLSAAVVLGSGSLFGCGSGIDTPSEGQDHTPSEGFGTAPGSNTPAASNTPFASSTPVQSTPEVPPTPVRVTPSSPPPAAAWQPPSSIDPSTPVGQHGQLRVQGTALVDQ